MYKAVIFFAFILCCILSLGVSAQKKSKSRNWLSGSKDQWWIGFKGGMNATSIDVTERFTAFSPTNALRPDLLDKQYENFTQSGTQAGLIVSYEFVDQISVSLQPQFINYRFRYSNFYSWVDFNEAGNQIDLNLEHDQRLNYLEIPLLFRYDFDVTASGGSRPSNGGSGGRWVPFVQLGGFYGKLLKGLKEIDIRQTDMAARSENELEAIQQTEDITDLLLQNHLGIIGGGGIGYTIGNARFSLEVNYKLGMNNITKEETRYANYSLVTGAYDVLDNMKLRNIELSLSFVMPLKFITSGNFKAI